MGQVFHLERLEGVRARVLDFFVWWDMSGPFPLVIDKTGGVRRDEATQAALYAKGRTAPGPHAGEPNFPPLGQTVTNAKTLIETPHGIGAAADAYPCALDSARSAVVLIYNDIKDRKTALMFTKYGHLAQENGLEWGAVWGDFPHVQIPKWRNLLKTNTA